jgi:hypothetical protein
MFQTYPEDRATQSTKHTPGPWEFGVRKNRTIWLSLGDPRGAPHYQGDLVASEADARLIAAAPDLLEACRLFAAYDAGDEDDVSLMLNYDEAITATRAAIKRATGA